MDFSSNSILSAGLIVVEGLLHVRGVAGSHPGGVNKFCLDKTPEKPILTLGLVGLR